VFQLSQVSVAYGDIEVLHDLEFGIQEGQVVALVGANGAGKTTTLNTISGLVRPRAARIEFLGQRIELLPAHRIVELGIVHVPEGRRLFPFLSVRDNLLLGAYSQRARRVKDETLKDVFTLLPLLEERQEQLAGSLSGGEQQMCAIGRGLMARPKLLMLDEPSLGLAPILVQTVLDTVRNIRAHGVTVLLVEQHVHHALALADYGYVLESGRVALQGSGADLLANPHLKRAYLGL
jgi:branched-chain amino acid transport system ATP-binding protein